MKCDKVVICSLILLGICPVPGILLPMGSVVVLYYIISYFFGILLCKLLYLTKNKVIEK